MLTTSIQGVFIYDCFITLDQERQVVWERKITGAGVIYLALRYTSLLNAIANIADDIIISCEVRLSFVIECQDRILNF